MKYSLLITLIILISSLFLASVFENILFLKSHADSGVDSRLEERISSPDVRMNHNGSGLLLAGDSITRRFEITGIDAWNKYLHQYHPVNLGVDGDTTSELLYRLENAPLSLFDPEVCTILIGVNDLIAGEKPVRVAEQIMNISRLISNQYPESRIFIFCIFPIGKTPGKIRNEINETNSILKKGYYPRNIRIIDLTHLFIDKEGFLTDAVLKDQLHLSKKGYEIWGQAIYQLINEPD